MKTLLLLLICGNCYAQIVTNFTTSEGLLHNNVNTIYAVDQTIWMGTQEGISKFDGTFTHYTIDNSGLIYNTIQAIYYHEGVLWAGTDFGLSKFDGINWTSYTETEGLGDNKIKCITSDDNNNIWVGHNDGFSIFDGTNWTNFGVSQGLPFGGINSITFSGGIAYLGSGLGGVIVYDFSNFQIINENNGLINNRIRSIAHIGNDKWIGTAEGISILNENNEISSQYTRIFSLPAPDTLNPIEGISIDQRGFVWVGIYVDYLVTEGGISVYDQHQWTEIKVSDGLAGPVIRALCTDSQDNCWVATSTGVSKITFDDLSIKEQTHPYQISPNPCQNHILIKGKTNETSIKIFNLQGKLIQSPEMRNSEILDVSILPPGFYILQLDDQKLKFVKQ